MIGTVSFVLARIHIRGMRLGFEVLKGITH